MAISSNLTQFASQATCFDDSQKKRRGKLFSSDEINLIFEREYQTRTLIETCSHNDSELEKIKKTYKNDTLPALRHVKAFLNQRKAFSVYQLAACTSLAYQAGIATIRECSNEILFPWQSDNVALQQTYLIPEKNSVIKKSDKRGNFEEKLIRDLMAFYLFDAVIPSWRFKTLSQEHLQKQLGIDQPEHLKAHIYTKQELLKYPKIRESVIDAYAIKAKKKLKTIGKIENRDTKKQQIKLTTRFLRKSAAKTNDTMSLYFFMHFKNPRLSERVNELSLQKWHYSCSSYSSEVSFKFTTIYHCLYPKGKFIQETPLQKRVYPQTKLRAIAEKAHWKFYLSHLHGYSTATGKIKPLVNCHVKPYECDMLIMRNIEEHSGFIEGIIDHLDEDSHLKLLLTGKFQMMDLHAGNIGFKRELNDNQRELLNTTFNVTLIEHDKDPINLTYSFSDLQRDYYENVVIEDDLITYKKKDGTLVANIPLGENTELLEMIACPFSLKLFDGDYVMGESNITRRIVYFRAHQKFLAYKNDLLNYFSPIKLSKKTLLKFLEEKPDLYRWIDRQDAPIRRHLSQKVQRKIQPFLDSILKQPQYNFSETNCQTTNKGIEPLIEDFSNLLATSYAIEYRKFWKAIEEDLNQVKIYSTDTYESIAQTYQQDVELLKHLNKNKKLIAGEWIQLVDRFNFNRVQIKIEDSLETIAEKYHQNIQTLTEINKETLFLPGEWIYLHDSKTKKILWRKKIAAQFSPRLTHHQIKALKERDQNAKRYITLYDRLNNFQGNQEELIALLRDFFSLPIFTFIEKKGISDLLYPSENNPYIFIDYESIRKSFAEEYRPTFKLVMASMYPLLLDTLDLVEYINAKNKIINEELGEKAIEDLHEWTHSSELKAIILAAQQVFSSSHIAHELSRSLQKRINEELNIYYQV